VALAAALALAVAGPWACEPRGAASAAAPRRQAADAPAGAPSAEPPRAREATMGVADAGGEPEVEAGAADAGKVERPRRPGAWANVDPDDDQILGPPDVLDDCEGELARAGVRYRKARLAVHKEKKSKLVCGAPQVVVYLGGPEKIAYSSPPLVTCTLALALASFEKIAQQEARSILKSPIVRIDHLGTYACREMARYPGWVSEHSYANAIDVSAFTLKDGRTVQVLRDFDASALDDPPPKKPAGRFLRRVSRRAYDEEVFSHVLTPFWDALHKNHFHLDLARFRDDGTRPHG
jgi:hypothetical protein